MSRLDIAVLALALSATPACNISPTFGDWDFSLPLEPETGTYWLTDVLGVEADPFADSGQLSDPPRPHTFRILVGDSVLTVTMAKLSLTAYPDFATPLYSLSLTFCHGEATSASTCPGTVAMCKWSGEYVRRDTADWVIADLVPALAVTSEPGFDCPVRPATWRVRSADRMIGFKLNRLAAWPLETSDLGISRVQAVFYRINDQDYR